MHMRVRTRQLDPDAPLVAERWFAQRRALREGCPARVEALMPGRSIADDTAPDEAATAQGDTPTEGEPA